MDLTGQIALVTGAGSGIGRASALRLARQGACVVAVDIDEASAQQTVDQMAADGARALGIRCDVAVLDEVRRELGPVTILVNNVGWDRPAPFLETTPDLWEKVITLNLRTTIYCTHTFLPGMIEAGSGRVINIASDAGKLGSSGEAIYSACKGGVIAFSKTIAREMARHQITVNAICPGPIDTPLVAGIIAERPRWGEALRRAVPLGRLGRPEEIAAMVAFPATPDASYITGQAISVGGGVSMQ